MPSNSGRIEFEEKKNRIDINKALDDYLKLPNTQGNIPHRVYCQRAAVMAFRYYMNERNWSEKRAAIEAYKQFYWDLNYKLDALEPTAGCFWKINKPRVETKTDLYLCLTQKINEFIM